MLGTIIGLSVGIVFGRVRVVRAECYSAHGGGDDYEENHDDDLNDPLPRPVPRHPFVHALFIIRAHRVKGGIALFRMLRFTSSKEGR